MKQKKIKLVVICVLALAIAAGIYSLMLNAEKKNDNKSVAEDKNPIPIEEGATNDKNQTDKATVTYIFKAADISEIGAGKIRGGDNVSMVVTYKNVTLGKIFTKQIISNVKVKNAFTTDGELVQKNDISRSAGMIELTVTIEEALELDNANLQGKLRAIKQNQTFDSTVPVAAFESQ